MNKFISTFILFFSIPFLLAISKSESLNQTEELIDEETMFNAGTWYLYMEKCDGKTYKKFIKELPRLSWPDFKNFQTGAARYGQNYTSGACSKKDTKKGADFYNWVLDELTYLTNDVQTSKRSDDDNLDNLDDTDDVEEKLIRLKSLFDKDIITEDEYTEKRKEILDSF